MGWSHGMQEYVREWSLWNGNGLERVGWKTETEEYWKRIIVMFRVHKKDVLGNIERRRGRVWMTACLTSKPICQSIQRSPRVRKQETDWRHTWWIQPSSLSWRMQASIQGYPVWPCQTNHSACTQVIISKFSAIQCIQEKQTLACGFSLNNRILREGSMNH